MLHEIKMPDWRGARGKGILYLGPNFSYRTEKWWATVTPMFQVSDVEIPNGAYADVGDEDVETPPTNKLFGGTGRDDDPPELPG